MIITLRSLIKTLDTNNCSKNNHFKNAFKQISEGSLPLLLRHVADDDDDDVGIQTKNW